MSWSPIALSIPSVGASSLVAELNRFTIAPWSYGVAEGEGLQTWLSFPDAVDAVSNKLALVPSSAVFVIAITASNYQDFANQCATLAAVFPFPELTLWQSRANSLVSLAVDKYQLINEQTTNRLSGLNSFPAVREAAAFDLTAASITAAADYSGTDALAALNDFQIRKLAYDAAAITPLPPLSGGTGWRFYAASDGANGIKSGHPGAENTLTAMLVLTGTPEDLVFLNELMP